MEKMHVYRVGYHKLKGGTGSIRVVANSYVQAIQYFEESNKDADIEGIDWISAVYVKK